MATLREVNKALVTTFPKIRLAQGRGYCYVYSKDDNLASQLAGLYTTSIPVCYVSQQTVEQWVKDVARVLADSDRFGLDKQPVTL